MRQLIKAALTATFNAATPHSPGKGAVNVTAVIHHRHLVAFVMIHHALGGCMDIGLICRQQRKAANGNEGRDQTQRNKPPHGDIVDRP